MVSVTHFADVAELADALDSGSSGGNFVEVQVLSSAPIETKRLKGNQAFLREGFFVALAVVMRRESIKTRTASASATTP